MRLAIIVPVLDEAQRIEACLNALAPLRKRGARVVVVDGGSRDDTVRRAATLSDRVICAPRGRALQMNAGARSEEGRAADVLLFLHADVELPADSDLLVIRALQRSQARWGRFDVRLQSDSFSPTLRLVGWMMNLRSRASGICTGDQAIFVEQGSFLALEGFAPIALMEDIEFSRRARQLSWPVAVRPPVTVSARRWERDGLWCTVLRMWRLRLAFFFGADPSALARRYRNVR